jgi:hypothetical protein
MINLLEIQFVDSRSGQPLRNSGQRKFPCDPIFFDLGRGRTVTVTVVDGCANCTGEEDLVLNDRALAELSSLGVPDLSIPVEWEFVFKE